MSRIANTFRSALRRALMRDSAITSSASALPSALPLRWRGSISLNVYRYAPFAIPIGFNRSPNTIQRVPRNRPLLDAIRVHRRAPRGPLFCRSGVRKTPPGPIEPTPDRTNSRSSNRIEDSLPQKNRRQGDRPLPPPVLSFNRICSLPVNLF
jgi:hypothetical protein